MSDEDAGEGPEVLDSDGPVEIVDGEIVDDALRIKLDGLRFEGGRLPLSALDTLQHLNAVVRSITRDVEVGLREDLTKPSRYSNFELALVGGLEDGSLIAKLLIIPLLLAPSGPATDNQRALTAALPEAVPATIEAVFSGGDPPYPISQRTAEAVATLGSGLGAEEELIIQPFDPDALKDAVDERAVSVTLERSTETRQAQQVTEARPFFVSGTIRHLENHGDKPGSLSLSTTHGLFKVPSVEPSLLSRAGGIIRDTPLAIVALVGQGVFDGKGRLQSLTHLTDMQVIDRPFNPDRRLAELRELSQSVGARLANSRPAIQRAVLATGRAPGLFLDEDDDLEARWLIRRGDEDRPSIVVSATFGSEITVYVYDRTAGEVTRDATIDLDGITPGDQIAAIIGLAESDANV